jgi:hypothetical protein
MVDDRAAVIADAAGVMGLRPAQVFAQAHLL